MNHGEAEFVGSYSELMNNIDLCDRLGLFGNANASNSDDGSVKEEKDSEKKSDETTVRSNVNKYNRATWRKHKVAVFSLPILLSLLSSLFSYHLLLDSLLLPYRL